MQYSGDLSKDELKTAIKNIESIGKDAAKFAKIVAGKAKKAAKPERDDHCKELRGWMCDNFIDIRMFGTPL